MAFEYLPGDTWIHHLDPRTKIFIWLTLLLVGMATTDPIWMIILFIAEILILRSAKVHMKKVTSFLKSLVGVSIFYAIVNLIWAPLAMHEVKILFYLIPPETWPISIESIVWAVGAVMRFLVLSLAVRTVLMLTPTRDVIYALIKFGLPSEFGLAMTSAFGFLPEIISELERIVHNWLTRHKISFDFQSSIAGGFYALGGSVVDFILKDMMVALRVQGTYWHTGVMKEGRDLYQREILEQLGYTVVDLWEADLEKRLE